MNAFTRMTFHDNADQAASEASAFTMGLGPNQLTWLRRNIDSFKHAEEQRVQLRHDVVRAARLAGLM
jgi:hypothetical protein